MTDIIKDFEEKISGNVLTYLKGNKEFELNNVKLFTQEIKDLKCVDPLIIAFGNITYDLLNKHFGESEIQNQKSNALQSTNKQRKLQSHCLGTLLNKTAE